MCASARRAVQLYVATSARFALPSHRKKAAPELSASQCVFGDDVSRERASKKYRCMIVTAGIAIGTDAHEHSDLHLS
jgi:hypothetical protein